jgi:hypothetical protein
MRMLGIKLEWIVIAALLLYIVYCQREHLTVGPEGSADTKHCPSGYAYDAIAKTCNPVNEGQGAGAVSPGGNTVPPDAIESTHASAAPAISTGPVTSTAPMTTPIPTMPPVKPPPPSSVMPATTTSSIPARH